MAKTKQTPLESVQNDLASAQEALSKVEEEYAAVYAAITEGDPVDFDQFSSLEQKRAFWLERVNGLVKREHKETVASKIKEAQDLRASHTERTREQATAILESFEDAVTALRALWKQVGELNELNATTGAIASDLALKGQDTPRPLYGAIRQINLDTDDLPPVLLTFAALQKAVEGERLKSTDADAVRTLVDSPRPKPSVVFHRLTEKAGRNRAKGSGQPVTPAEKASYIQRRENGLSPAEAAKSIGRDN